MGAPKGTEEDDYVFRYRLTSEEDEALPYYEDPVLEMIRRQLANLLDLAVPTYQGREVRLDGFKMLSDLDTVYELFPIRTSRGANSS